VPLRSRLVVLGWGRDVEQASRRVDNYPAAFDIHDRDYRSREWDEDARGAGNRQLKQITCTMIVDGDDLAQELAERSLGGKANEIGVVEIVGVRFRQTASRCCQVDAVHRFRIGAGVDPVDAYH
jgi:hypothetical protein